MRNALWPDKVVNFLCPLGIKIRLECCRKPNLKWSHCLQIGKISKWNKNMLSNAGTDARKTPLASCQRWWNETTDIRRANRCRQTCMCHTVEIMWMAGNGKAMETDLHAKRLIVIPWLSWTQTFIYMINSWTLIQALVCCFPSIPCHLAMLLYYIIPLV